MYKQLLTLSFNLIFLNYPTNRKFKNDIKSINDNENTVWVKH